VNRFAALVALAACQPPGASTPTTRPAPAPLAFSLRDLVGDWRWLYHADEAGTSRVEDERWRFERDPGNANRLLGRYLRSVEVRALDREPFHCNQRPWYRQRALYDVTAELDGDQFVIRETGYTTEPSPCDHGFRHMADYRATPRGDQLALSWGDGSQTLWQIDDAAAPLPEAPWPQSYTPEGAWQWDASSYDADGNIHDEHEWWEITRRGDTRLDATYRRRVTVRSPDGKVIPCAGAASWSFDDAYVLDGQKEEEHWHLWERAVSPGDHPCLRATPRRTLDEATAEQIGAFFVMEWRGKRREILYRPDPAPGT